MNNDLISRKALIEAYDKAHKGTPGGARKLMEEAPGVDAAPVVHGRWINRQNWSVTCSVCGSLGIAHDGKNYCPYCGAKMDGGKA